MEEQDYNSEEQPQNYMPQNYEVDESVIKAQIDVEETMLRFEMETLRGMKLVVDLKNKKREYRPIAPGAKKLCNELGIREILGRLRGRVTTIGRLTIKTDDEVMKDMFYFHMSLADLFTKRADDWDMDEEMIKPILDSCVELVQDLVFSSRKGFNAINLKSQYSRSEIQNTTSNENQGVKSILGIKLKR